MNGRVYVCVYFNAKKRNNNESKNILQFFLVNVPPTDIYTGLPIIASICIIDYVHNLESGY